MSGLVDNTLNMHQVIWSINPMWIALSL